MASGQRQTVNGIQTINLHGKNYVEVAERVHMVHEKKAKFSIIKSEPVNIADRWLWIAVIMVDGEQYIGNAEIKMNAPKNTPDGTNPFECGETSAIGRALAFAGFGSVESIASKDEIERSKPFSGSEHTKASNKPSQEQKTGESHNTKSFPPYYAIYQAGKEKNLWQGIRGFCEYASGELGTTVNAEDAASLEQAQLDQLMASITGEDPALAVAATSNK